MKLPKPLLSHLTEAAFVFAMAWATLRLGAAPNHVLLQVVLILGLGALIALALLPLTPTRRMGAGLVLGLIGAGLLASLALRPTVVTRGYAVATVGWLGLLVALSLYRNRPASRRRIVYVILALGVLEAVLGVVQVATSGGDQFATGTFVNRNHYAAFLNMALGLAIGVLMLSEADTSRQRSERRARAWLTVLVCTGLVAGVLLTRSRGGAIALVATLVVALLVARVGGRRSRASTAAVGTVLALSIALGLTLAAGSLFGRFADLDEVARAPIYRDTVRMIADHPLLGIGPGMYRWRFGAYQSADTTKRYSHAHNDYLETAAEWGVPLAALFWLFVLWRLSRVVRTAIRSPDPASRSLAVGTAAALVSIVVHSAVDFSLRIPANLLLFVTLLAMAWSLDEPRPPTAEPVRQPTAAKAGRLTLLLFLLLAMVRTSTRLIAEEITIWDPSISGFETALFWDPVNPYLHWQLATWYHEDEELADPEIEGSYFERATELKPFSALYQRDLARHYERQGDLVAAEERALLARDLMPRHPRYNWHLASFYLRHDQPERALAPLRLALESEPNRIANAVELLIEANAPRQLIDQAVPGNPESRLVLLRSLVEPEAPEVLQDPGFLDEQWRVVLSGAMVDVDAADFYVRYLLDHHRLAAARAAWRELQERSLFGDSAWDSGDNAIWNGGFDLPFGGKSLGWRSRERKGYTIERTADERRPGDSVVTLRFDGTENPDLANALEQSFVVATPASYRLTMEARADHLTTDRGVFGEIYDPVQGRALCSTAELNGTTGWIEVSCDLRIESASDPRFGGRDSSASGHEQPTSLRLFRFRLKRVSSQRIENQLGGQLSIAHVGVARVP